MGFVRVIPKVVFRSMAIGLSVRLSRFRTWPPRDGILLDAPLAMAEQRMSRLRRIYSNAQRDAWDAPAVFREAMEKHGGIQLDEEKRVALAYPISMLMWGELAAWIVSAELAERLEDPDARMAASAQVFDEARHFYVLRDYLAALHVPVPELDPYFATGIRKLLLSKDLTLKLFAMQILAEGTAQAIFRFLADSEVEPVLGEILPLIERDEARHVGLGIMHLPQRLDQLSERKRRKLASQVGGIGDLFGATQIRYLPHYQTVGADPRELIRRADKMLHELAQKLGTVPGTDEPYFRTEDTTSPDYERKLDFVLPKEGSEPSFAARMLKSVIDRGSWLLFAS